MKLREEAGIATSSRERMEEEGRNCRITEDDTMMMKKKKKKRNGEWRKGVAKSERLDYLKLKKEERNESF